MFSLTEIDDSISLYHGDCLEVMPFLASEGVKADLVLADPPYGTTHCRWDSVIDIPRMWTMPRFYSGASFLPATFYKRIGKFKPAAFAI